MLCKEGIINIRHLGTMAIYAAPYREGIGETVADKLDASQLLSNDSCLECFSSAVLLCCRSARIRWGLHETRDVDCHLWLVRDKFSKPSLEGPPLHRKRPSVRKELQLSFTLFCLGGEYVAKP